MRVIAHMVTKNEADRWLELTLARLVAQFGEVAVYDDGSTDATRSIAGDLGAVVHRREHRDVPFSINEGQFRADGWRWAMRALDLRPDDIVVVVDADEALVGADPVKVVTDAMGTVNLDTAMSLPVHEVWGFNQVAPLVRVDATWGREHVTRVGRAGWEPMFRERHAFAAGAVPDRHGAVLKFHTGGLAIAHLGYAVPKDRAVKYERYRGGGGHFARHVESIRAIGKHLALDIAEDDRPWWDDARRRWMARCE